jgi:transposase
MLTTIVGLPIITKTRTKKRQEIRCYRRRWKVERLFAWLHNFRRLVVRYEYHVENFLAMVHLGCAKILFRFFEVLIFRG